VLVIVRMVVRMRVVVHVLVLRTVGVLMGVNVRVRMCPSTGRTRESVCVGPAGEKR
jgi:hypothetical protein